jgi:hypothetical protein
MKTLIVILIIVALCSAERDWYVSKRRGSDDNDGTNEKPYLTIRKAYLSSKDGDSILIEASAYNEENTIQKSLKIKGINGRPLIRGSFYFKSGVKIEFSDIDMESNTSDMISAEKLEFLKIYNVNLGPTYQRQGRGLRLHTVKSLEISNVKVHETDIGISVYASNFKIKNVEVTKSKVGMALWFASKGTLDNSTISHCSGSYNLDGAGINVNGDITLNNVNLLNNEASVYKKTGGGFYCGGGDLNIFGGKIIGNKALNGGAGECNSCSFFISGTEIRDNESEFPSTCRGIPSSGMKYKISK